MGCYIWPRGWGTKTTQSLKKEPPKMTQKAQPSIWVKKLTQDCNPGVGESKSTLFGLLKVDAVRKSLRLLNASESATACFVINLNMCYWLFKCWVLRVLCVCVWERETGSHHSGVYSLSGIILIVARLQIHTSIITVSVTRFCSPLGLDLMVKLRTLTVFTFILKAVAGDYGKGITFQTRFVVFYCFIVVIYFFMIILFPFM